MLELLKAFYHKIFSRDLYTWIGHGLAGFVITFFVGWQFTLGAFVYREASDLLGWVAKDPATRRPWGDAIKDGFFDLWAPLAGAAIAMILRG